MIPSLFFYQRIFVITLLCVPIKTVPMLSPTHPENQYSLTIKKEKANEKKQQNEVVLRAAAKENDIKLTRTLIKTGVNVNAQNCISGDTALHLAAREGHLIIGTILLNSGAHVNIQNEAGNTSFHEITHTQNNIQFFHLLLKHNIDPHIKNKAGYKANSYLTHTTGGLTPEEGIDPTKNKFIASAHATLLSIQLTKLTSLTEKFHAAARCNNHEDLTHLIQCNIDINHQDIWFGDTALHEAAYYGHLKIIKTLLENKAQVNIQNNKGEAPLHIAMQRQHADIILELLKHEATPTIKDKNRCTADDYLSHIRGCSPIEKINFAQNKAQNKRMLSIHADILCTRLKKFAEKISCISLEENIVPTTQNS